MDFIVESQVIVELKSVEAIHNVHTAQILTYMKFAEINAGLLINFNVSVLKNGIKRFIN
jgi:GxxExxY protein